MQRMRQIGALVLIFFNLGRVNVLRNPIKTNETGPPGNYIFMQEGKGLESYTIEIKSKMITVKKTEESVAVPLHPVLLREVPRQDVQGK